MSPSPSTVDGVRSGWATSVVVQHLTWSSMIWPVRCVECRSPRLPAAQLVGQYLCAVPVRGHDRGSRPAWPAGVFPLNTALVVSAAVRTRGHLVSIQNPRPQLQLDRHRTPTPPSRFAGTPHRRCRWLSPEGSMLISLVCPPWPYGVVAIPNLRVINVRCPFPVDVLVDDLCHWYCGGWIVLETLRQDR